MKKLIPLILLALFIQNPSYSIGYDELNLERPLHNRLGIGETPENNYEIKSITENKTEKKEDVKKEISNYDLNYADLSLKRIAIDISDEVEEEQATILEDLSTLWVAAAQKSETLQYTIYKLSNPDAEKPTEGILRKIVRPIASFSTIAGTAFSANPFMASGALIGGNLLNALTSNTAQEINYQFSKVNDADMVLLVRKIDDLQKKLLNLYIDFKTKEKIYEMSLENLDKREKIYKSMQDKSKEELILADVYYRNAQNAATKAKNEYHASKTILEQLVGTEAVKSIQKQEETISDLK